MTISVGSKLPDAEFTVMTDDGPAKLTTSELCAGKKIVLVAVPGAFTPTCHANHLPGFLENIDAIKGKGVDEVAVTSVNDVFVMGGWAAASKANGKITFLADHDASFAKALGMDIDLSAAGLGTRSKRYSMIVEDGTVTSFNLEESPGTAEISSAAQLINQL